MKDVRVGIYVRLSNDDLREGESMSIENQKHMLMDFCFQQGWKIIDIYADDGYTGLNFNRPQVQRLIEDAKLGKINLILVKDLSRFGRNHLECGYYEEELFPSIGCRFIALNDGIDTARDGNDIMPFQNVYNELYSKDMSQRVRTAKHIRAKNGSYLAAYAPYGYEKKDHRLVIDETAAEIVRYIFKLRLEGKSCCRIAAILNEQQIVPPRDYYYQKRNKPNPRNVHHRWTDNSIAQMLKNEVYIGNTVQYKTEAPSYKCRKQMPQKPEQWVRCDNTHEPIISREDWDAVQSLWKQTTARKKPVYNPLFTGLLRCADCGAHMNFKPDMNRRKDGTNLQHHAYTCGTYKHGGSGACTSHWIMENALMELVRNDLEQYVQGLEMNEEQLQAILMEQYSRDTKSDRTSTEKELHSAKTRIVELEMMQSKLYEELLLSQLPRETLIEISQKYKTEKTALEQKMQELQSELDRLTAKAEDIRSWLCVVREYMSGTVLDRELLHRLIKVIRVGETTVVDGQKQREVEIIYRF